MGCEQSKQKSQEIVSVLSKNSRNKKVNKKFVDDDRIYENVEKNSMQPSQEDIERLQKNLSQHFFFYKLQKQEQNELINYLEGYSASAQTIIFKKGDNPNLFFFIKSGKVEVDIGVQGKNRILHAGQSFGELALLYKAPRSATITAIEECQFFCLTHKIFRKTMQEITMKNFSNARKHIQKASIFNYLTERQKIAITYNTHSLKYEKDQVIFKEGDDATSFYIITKGQVEVFIPGKQPIKMGVGQSFGQNSFQKKTIRSGTVKAASKVSVLSIGCQALRKSIGGQLQDLSFYNIMKWAMNRHNLLCHLNDLQRQKIISISQIKQFKDQQIILEKGAVVENFIICLQGNINNEEVGSIFNVDFIIQQDSQKRNLQDLIKKSSGNIAIFNYQKILEVLHVNTEQLFKRSVSLKQIKTKREQYMDSVSLESLIVKHKLGAGLFGKVLCVEDQCKRQYALKCIQKSGIIEKKMEYFIINEKKFLQELSSPFIVSMYKTFHSPKYVFFLMKYINGGDFFKVMRNIGVFSKSKAQFYFGCLLLAIQHLHNKNIVYRDIKPENTVADKAGYLYLVDLGTAKSLQLTTGYKTFTIIGTPHYMAPQIIQGQGYSFPVDLWSMGIFLYQIICGHLPFGDDCQDPYQIFRQIQECSKINYPSSLKDRTTIQLIQKLLSRDERQRHIQNFVKLKNMSFFEDFNWDKLQKKKMQTPFTINRDKLNKIINKPLLQYLSQNKEIETQRTKQSYKSQGSVDNIISKNEEWNRLFPNMEACVENQSKNVVGQGDSKQIS